MSQAKDAMPDQTTRSSNPYGKRILSFLFIALPIAVLVGVVGRGCAAPLEIAPVNDANVSFPKEVLTTGLNKALGSGVEAVALSDYSAVTPEAAIKLYGKKPGFAVVGEPAFSGNDTVTFTVKLSGGSGSATMNARVSRASAEVNRGGAAPPGPWTFDTISSFPLIRLEGDIPLTVTVDGTVVDAASWHEQERTTEALSDIVGTPASVERGPLVAVWPGKTVVSYANTKYSKWATATPRVEGEVAESSLLGKPRTVTNSVERTPLFEQDATQAVTRLSLDCFNGRAPANGCDVPSAFTRLAPGVESAVSSWVGTPKVELTGGYGHETLKLTGMLRVVTTSTSGEVSSKESGQSFTAGVVETKGILSAVSDKNIRVHH